MKFLDKIEPLLLLAAVAAGVLLGGVKIVESLAQAFISPFLTFMLFGLFWDVPLGDLSKSFRNVKFTFTAFTINFIWTPLFAWLLTRIFLEPSPQLALGFILLMVTPCTDWYLVFTNMAKGDLKLSLAILPVNLITQVLLLPIYILILGGSVGWTDPLLLLKSAVMVLIVPFALAKAVKYLLRKQKKASALMENIFVKRQFFWLWMAILAMFASERIIGSGYLPIFLSILFPVLIFFVLTFFISRTIGKLMGFGKEGTVSLMFTTLARNSPLALAFAQRAFPQEKMILIPLVIGPLIELPILALMAQFLIMLGARPDKAESSVRGS
ncbi:MAG: bile acid:sodium symporter [Deltaproteobacteria bacterium]|jgi:ACR3 family arsenite efflux pump ArsB|nr:bile acid:sodium symporter [Deltaproteobacteria bacterium]